MRSGFILADACKATGYFVGLVLLVAILLGLFAGIVWCNGWLLVNLTNVLANKQVMPETHKAYFAAGLLLSIFASACRRKEKS